MEEYRVGSICEVIDTLGSTAFANMLGEIVTITSPLKAHDTKQGVFVYEVNDGKIQAADAWGDNVRFTPPHKTLKLITPPPEGKGLELILGMFPKVEETVV